MEDLSVNYYWDWLTKESTTGGVPNYFVYQEGE